MHIKLIEEKSSKAFWCISGQSIYDGDSTVGRKEWCFKPARLITTKNTCLFFIGKYHYMVDLLFVLFGCSCFAYAELVTCFLVWLNPNQSNRRSAVSECSLITVWKCCRQRTLTVGGSITVQLVVSSLTGLDYTKQQENTLIFVRWKTTESFPVKLETNRSMIFSPTVSIFCL